MLLKVSIQNKFQFRVIPDFRNVFFHQRGDMHYIGGVDVLPSPLNAEDERMCILQLAKGDEEYHALGAKAKAFVISEKTNVKQAEKLLCFIENIRKK